MTGMKCCFPAKVISDAQTNEGKNGPVTNLSVEYPEFDGSTSQCVILCFGRVAGFVSKRFTSGDEVIIEGSTFLNEKGLFVRAFRITPAPKEEEPVL